jgi:hypothetical protein
VIDRIVELKLYGRNGKQFTGKRRGLTVALPEKGKICAELRANKKLIKPLKF